MPSSKLESHRLIIGIDGGGTKTVALLGQVNDANEVIILGEGFAGPSNQRAVGPVMAMSNLDKAVQFAFDAASIPRQTVEAACLGLAGADRDSDRSVVERWAEEARLAHKVRVVNDAVPLLYAASDDGVGIALIAGTGSLAYGRNADNKVARSGGWGYLFGDEGSAFAIGRAVLVAASRVADGRGPNTSLLQAVQSQLQIATPFEIVPAVYGNEIPRAIIASLAPIAFTEAEASDSVAQTIITASARDLAEMVLSVAHQLNLASMPLFFTGALLLSHESYRNAVREEIINRQIRITSIHQIPQPATGAVRIAEHLRTA